MDRNGAWHGPAFPLEIGPTGRYLVDQGGEPFLMVGDSAWSLIVGTQRREVLTYLLDRRRRGFNAITVEMTTHLFSYDPPRNWYGAEPFTTPGDFTTPNAAYFDHAEWVLRKAAEFGFLVVLYPMNLGYVKPGGSEDFGGYGGRAEGWYAEVVANGVEGCREYGRYLGRRFRGLNNIIWSVAGDRGPGEVLEHIRAMVRGIQDESGHRLFTAHIQQEFNLGEHFPDDPWLTVGNTYSYGIVHRRLLEDYNSTPVRPNIFIESTYENEHNASPLQVRRQAYWGMLCGACGQFMGNLPVWHFAPGWVGSLDSPAANEMTHLRDLFAECRWWDLVPDQEHEVVVGGLGEFRGLDYCAAARTPKGDLVMSYMPTPRTITVDMARLYGETAAAWWFDPLTGGRRTAGEHPTRGLRDFVAPGDQDWVLVLEGGK